MSLKIKFDPSGTPVAPTLLLGKRAGQIVGQILAENIHAIDSMNDAAELSFQVHKYINGEKNPIWDELIDFRLVYAKDYDIWYEMYVEVAEDDETTKSIQCTELGIAELSQINVYGTYIGTYEDVDSDDYDKNEHVVLYRPSSPRYSCLNRILDERAPHYTIEHVDSSIMEQRCEFTFDNQSVWDCLNTIAEKIGCIFFVKTGRTDEQDVTREIYVYDLDSTCNDCGFRGDFYGVCPECGGTDLVSSNAFGHDTTIFVSADELGDDITFDTDEGAVKNCFRLEAGDDEMTATVRNCNPSGTDYLWYIPEYMRQDMSIGLQTNLANYDTKYDAYQKTYEYIIDSTARTRYNTLVSKYADAYHNYDDEKELKPIASKVVGYPALMNVYYDAIDFYGFLDHSMMPNIETAETNATKEAKKLNDTFGSGKEIPNIALGENYSVPTLSGADSAALAMAVAIVSANYQVKIKTSSLSGTTWIGVFTVTRYSNSDDTADSSSIRVGITYGISSMQLFCEQKIAKIMAKMRDDDLDITGLFNIKRADWDSWFPIELKKYARVPLQTFLTVANAVITVMNDQGLPDGKTWSSTIKTDLYDPYMRSLTYLNSALAEREYELRVICGKFKIRQASDGKVEFEDLEGYYVSRDKQGNPGYGLYFETSDSFEYTAEVLTLKYSGNTVTKGVLDYIIDLRSSTQHDLDFNDNIGEEYLAEFLSFRRDDVFSDSNYVCDGLTNAKIFERAQEFLKKARSEIYKSAEKQHTISATLKDLLVIDKFKPLRDMFELGNWLRVKVDDEIYKLRLIQYEIDYGDLNNITVDFSDVLKTQDGISDQQTVIQQSQSMATSYGTTQRQASEGKKSYTKLNGWSLKGLDVTNQRIVAGATNQTQTWDSNGMQFRKYYEETDTYDPEQLKILNSSMVFTDDDWATLKTAVGKFYYYDPADNNALKSAYGINGEVVIGQLILGENLGIYNSGGYLKFDSSGLSIENQGLVMKFNENNGLYVQKNGDGNSFFKVDPNASDSYFIKAETPKGYLRFDNLGDLTISGKIQNSNFYINTDGSLGNYSGNFSVSSTGALSCKQLSVTNGNFYINTNGSFGYDNGSKYFKVSSTGNVDMRGNITLGYDNNNYLKLMSTGGISGYINAVLRGFIDFSASTLNTDTGKYIYGIQMQGQVLRISTTKIAVAASDDIQVNATFGYTGTSRIVHWIKDNEDGTITWNEGDIQFINGIMVTDFDKD